MKVLILSCQTGGGHNTCAKYIEEELTQNNIENIKEDFYTIVNASAKELSSKIYLKTLSHNGRIFKNLYTLGELYSKTKVKSPVYLVNKLHAKKLYDYIIDNAITLVIATHLFPALTLTAINKEYKNKIPFITVATDYEPCPFIEEVKPNYLIIPKYLEEKFISKGIDKNIIVPSGIPISTRFLNSAKNIKDKINIKNEKIILIMLGSMGFGNIMEIIKDIEKIDNIKVIIVCGNNQNLQKQLLEIHSPKLIIYGYVHNINDLIYTSDIVLSKPGGLSTTEIASFNKPLLHIYPIPGIETHNSTFFANKKMSLVCKTNESIITNINRLLNDSKLRSELINNQHKYINRNSAKDLIKLIKDNFN